jgi:hypothetical protein
MRSLHKAWEREPPPPSTAVNVKAVQRISFRLYRTNVTPTNILHKTQVEML